ncbi:hypothetical protein EDD18DRAFT_1128744 [Armillaria luteobubalina]|uniref:Uncharacterized protein n=1 Tax=Armillaria luteobubalina TaxID=153913 RepID=A0AA39QP20_9AGAR|nr:hypothetical protein EDD18DRAFT_1128744 [Armillaria luteobubalina]
MIPRTRSISFRLIALGGILTLFLVLYTFTTTPSFDFLPFLSEGRTRSSCPPEEYSNGQWVYDTSATNRSMAAQSDALEFSGFQGCASSREFYWHLGAGEKEEEQRRFPRVTNWRWQPSPQCTTREFSAEAMVRDLVEQGGWLLLGDSITEGQFFSLSCMLFPHVIATPDYIKNPYFDRAWPQNLYINPESLFIHKLRFPPGFDITITPLVTFRRVDLLLEQRELVELHRVLHDPPEDFSLFSEEQAWNLSPDYYLQLFAAPLPEANYGNMILSTGGHWTTTLFSGYRDESKEEQGFGIDGVISFFREAMSFWADQIQSGMRSMDGQVLANGKRGRRQVVVRAYLPGHEDCHKAQEPWTEIQPWIWRWFNWANIEEYNQVFQDVLSNAQYPDIHFLPIDRPARLRPDAHVTSDCLHIMTGAGVLEGWSHYTWHYLTRELGSQIR